MPQNLEGENSFFNSIIYGLMHEKTDRGKRKTTSRKAKDILGEKLYDQLSEIRRK